MGFSVRHMQESDAELILGWRNHPEIRKWMLTQHEITLEEHMRWFQRSSVDPEKLLLVVEDCCEPVGFVNFTGVVAGGATDWGFYVAPGALKGTGRKLGRAALNHVFRDFRVHKVCGQALEYNVASIGFHEALGFQREGVLREQHLINDSYHDLICFGLLSSEWANRELGQEHG